MLKTNFASNKTGKLLPELFTTVRLHDGSYQVGQSRDILLKNLSLGTGEVMEIIQFKMRDLPDVIAFADCGNNAEYLKKILYRFYKDIHDDSLIDVVAIKWTDRRIDVQEDMFKNFWNKVEENFHPTLFNQ